MEWFSVKDKSPEINKLVVSADMAEYDKWQVKDDDRYGLVKLNDNNEFIYFDADCDVWEIDENVTHWASLELPQS